MNLWKYIFVGGASALVGGIAGYFFAKKKLEDKYYEDLNKAIDEECGKIREEAAKHPFQPTSTLSPSHEVVNPMERIPDAVAALFASKNGYDASLREEYRKRWEAIGYSDEDISTWLHALDAKADVDRKWKEKMSAEYGPDDLPFEDLGADYEPQQDEFDDGETPDEYYEQKFHGDEGPVVVTLERYQELPSYYQPVTFHYFEDDDVLIDDGDMIVEDIFATVGDALSKFGNEAMEMNNDADAVYVKNGKYGLAIEIVRMRGSYEAFMGVR